MLMGMNRLFCRNYHSLQVISPPQLPRQGPAILVCNHISGVDPMLIQSVVNRPIIWMMAREYYEIPALRRGFELIGAIPVARGGRDSAALRAALRALHAGRVLGVFPEGRIETSDALFPFQTGVALMAIKTGVPVYPAYLQGNLRGRRISQAVLLPSRCRIGFGKKVTFDRSSTDRETLEAATRSMECAVAQIRENNLDKLLRL